MSTAPTTNTNRINTSRAAFVGRAIAVVMLLGASLLALAAPASASDSFGIDKEQEVTHVQQCGQADKDGVTCIDIDCSPVSHVCTAFWFCKTPSGGVSPGVCGSKRNTAAAAVGSIVAVDTGGDPEPVAALKTR